MTCCIPDNILGRIFRGSGEPFDDGPDLSSDPKIEVAGPTVNPMMRVMPDKMIQTEVPMIDLFNCLVESQKIPIFSVAGICRPFVRARSDSRPRGGPPTGGRLTGAIFTSWSKGPIGA